MGSNQDHLYSALHKYSPLLKLQTGLEIELNGIFTT